MFPEYNLPPDYQKQIFEQLSVEPAQLISRKLANGVNCVGIGESHDNGGLSHLLLLSLLPTLASEGVDTLFLELDSVLQADIDNYLKNRDETALARIVSHERAISRKCTGSLKFLNTASVFTTYAHWISGRFEHYYKLLDVSRSYGLRVIAIDNLNLDPNTAEVDRYMAKMITEDKCNKGIVYVGSAHLCGSAQGGLGISKFIPNELDMYSLRTYFHNDPDRKYMSEVGISQRLFKLVDSSSKLKKMTAFALDFSDSAVNDVMKSLYPPSVVPKRIADGLIYLT